MNEKTDVRRVAFLGLMTALVFAGNYARITLPVPVGGIPSFTLANILCVLSGLLFGPAGGSPPAWAPPSMTSPFPPGLPRAGSPS